MRAGLKRSRRVLTRLALIAVLAPLLVGSPGCGSSGGSKTVTTFILWLVDGGNNRVLIFPRGTGDAKPATTVLGQADLTSSGAATTASGLDSPADLQLDGAGYAWISDTGNNRVVGIEAPFTNGKAASVVLGQPDFTSKTPSLGAGGLDSPTGIYLDKNSYLWVADTANNRVLGYEAPFSTGMDASVVLGQPDFASSAGATTQNGLNAPMDVAVDVDGNLWVADFNNNRVLQYRPPFVTGMNASIVIGRRNFTETGFGVSRRGLHGPVSIAFDAKGRMWVSDQLSNRVLKYPRPFVTRKRARTVVGQAEFSISDPATSRTGLRGPGGVAIDTRNNLWVADTQNNRLLEYDKPLKFNGSGATRVWGQADFFSSVPGLSSTTFTMPNAIAFQP